MLRLLQIGYHRLCPRIEVTKRLYGLRCRLNINDHLMWLVYPETYTIERPSFDLLSRRWGKVWDVGCNFGFYSMVAARAGNDVFAFDMSPRALTLLERSCRLNGVAVTKIARPMTTESVNYAAPDTSACTNQCRQGSGSLLSITYLEAERLYGTPTFIKMDIEGGEQEFIGSAPFQAWVSQRGITLLIELHRGILLNSDSFSQMHRRNVDVSHVLISPAQTLEKSDASESK